MIGVVHFPWLGPAWPRLPRALMGRSAGLRRPP